MNDFNQTIIDEFRSNDGVVGVPFEGAPIILLHHFGRKSGAERVSPLAYQKVDAGWAVFGSKGGAPEHPEWYLNLLAHPDTSIELGTETLPVHVREAEGDERDVIWEKQKVLMPGFAEYEEKAEGRKIPVVVLEPRG